MTETRFAPPKAVRAVFLLTVFKLLIATTFFVVALTTDFLPLPASAIGMTAGAYLLFAIGTFVSIHRHSALGTRAFIVLAILASLPGRAVIGIAFDLIALGVTFLPSARAFFQKGTSS